MAQGGKSEISTTSESTGKYRGVQESTRGIREEYQGVQRTRRELNSRFFPLGMASLKIYFFKIFVELCSIT